MLIIAIIRSLFCPTVLCKYDLRKYVNTFRVRNETSRISYVLNMWNVLLWNAPCLIPAASYLAREILFEGSMENLIVTYQRLIGVTI